MYKTGEIVTINVKGDIRKATIREDGVKDGKVRIRPEGYPFDISIKESEIVK